MNADISILDRSVTLGLPFCVHHKFRRFRQSFDDRPYFDEPLLVPFYTSLNTDISGTRKDIKKQSVVFFSVFPVLSYQGIKILFHIHLKH